MDNLEISSPIEQINPKKHRALDMKPFLEKVLPIEEVFSPGEEVEKLWSVPREQRREAVKTFKNKLARQREAWALCRTSIEERIEDNFDFPRERMVGIIEKFASHYGFSEPHIKIAKELVDDYIAAHNRVIKVRRKYPDNTTLVNRLTGMKFTRAAGNFDIAVGPMSIDISCSGSNAGRICEKSKNPVIGFQYAGFILQSDDKRPIHYVVINTDTVHDHYRHETLSHEHEHRKNKLLKSQIYEQEEICTEAQGMLNEGVGGFLRHRIFEKIFHFERRFETELLNGYENTCDLRQKTFFLEEFMRLKRGSALNQVKNEIIACLKGGESPIF